MQYLIRNDFHSQDCSEDIATSEQHAVDLMLEALDGFIYHCANEASTAKNDLIATMWRKRIEKAETQKTFLRNLPLEMITYSQGVTVFIENYILQAVIPY